MLWLNLPVGPYKTTHFKQANRAAINMDKQQRRNESKPLYYEYIFLTSVVGCHCKYFRLELYQFYCVDLNIK